MTTITFLQFANEWFYGEYQQRVTLITLKKNQHYLVQHLLPYFKDKSLHDLSTEDILDFLAKKRQENYSERTIFEILLLLSTMFNFAVRNGILDESPMIGILKMIKQPKPGFRPWSNDELFKFLEMATDEGEGVMYEFILTTGIKLRELLTLSWSGIDFEKGTVTINDPRTMRSSSRTVKLTPHLLTGLQAHNEKQKWFKELDGEQYHHNRDLVFPNRVGEIQKHKFVLARFKRLINKANVRRIDFHELRKMHVNLHSSMPELQLNPWQHN